MSVNRYGRRSTKGYTRSTRRVTMTSTHRSFHDRSFDTRAGPVALLLMRATDTRASARRTETRHGVIILFSSSTRVHTTPCNVLLLGGGRVEFASQVHVLCARQT